MKSRIVLFAFFLGSASLFATDSRAETCERWFKPSAGPTEAVAIVAHGMNNKPEVMDDLVRTLTDRGVEVLRAGFSGHCGRRNEFFELTVDELKGNALQFHAEASRRATELGKPLHLVAYSFSATLYELLRPQTPFERRIYLAPALATHWWYPIVRLLSFLPTSLPIPSVVPEEYRANSGTGSASIRVLSKMLSEWESAPAAPSPGPTLILIHPDDELVSKTGIEAWISSRKLGSWSIVPVDNSGCSHPRPQAHRIIDEVSVGRRQWEIMVTKIDSFLSEGWSESK